MSKKIKEMNPIDISSKIKELNGLGYDGINSQIRHLMGDVLTVVEASYPEGKQLEAVKSLIKSKFSAKLSWVYELCGYPEDANIISEVD